ncbi:unnamed protein product [Arctogadus glacialis]
MTGDRAMKGTVIVSSKYKKRRYFPFGQSENSLLPCADITSPRPAVHLLLLAHLVWTPPPPSSPTSPISPWTPPSTSPGHLLPPPSTSFHLPQLPWTPPSTTSFHHLPAPLDTK